MRSLQQMEHYDSETGTEGHCQLQFSNLFHLIFHEVRK